LRDEQIAELGRLLGITTPRALSELKLKLEWIGARYRLWIQQDDATKKAAPSGFSTYPAGRLSEPWRLRH